MDSLIKTDDFSNEDTEFIESLLIPEVKACPAMYDPEARKKIANFSMDREFANICKKLDPAFGQKNFSRFICILNKYNSLVKLVIVFFRGGWTHSGQKMEKY